MAERIPLPRKDPRFDAAEMRRFFAPQMQLRPGDELPFIQRALPDVSMMPRGPTLTPEVLMQLFGLTPGADMPMVRHPFDVTPLTKQQDIPGRPIDPFEENI